MLRSTNPALPPIPADSGMTIVAEYVRTLDQREFNPLAQHIGRTFRREDVPPLYGHTFNPGNWNTGHVSLGEDVVLFITLHKTAGAEGADYDDRLDGPGVLVWSSQTSTGPETKKGREILGAPTWDLERVLREGRVRHRALYATCTVGELRAMGCAVVPTFGDESPHFTVLMDDDHERLDRVVALLRRRLRPNPHRVSR